MKVIVTAGPAYEPIDEVRRLTNFSTGELGVMLANELAASGFEVICLRGVTATHPGSLRGVHHQPFTTNDDLFGQLNSLSRNREVDAVFHAAALCDFKVKRVENSHGVSVQGAKIDSRVDSLTLVLEPARKVLASLRELFPNAALVGWKYELESTRVDALQKAWRQIRENGTDACILNGRAYGTGFALCIPPTHIQEFKDKAELTQFLPGWLKQRRNLESGAGTPVSG